MSGGAFVKGRHQVHVDLSVADHSVDLLLAGPSAFHVEQTRANRRIGGRKAALAAKAKRAREQARREAELGPAGTHRGSAPLAPLDMSIPAILARLRAGGHG